MLSVAAAWVVDGQHPHAIHPSAPTVLWQQVVCGQSAVIFAISLKYFLLIVRCARYCLSHYITSCCKCIMEHGHATWIKLFICLRASDLLIVYRYCFPTLFGLCNRHLWIKYIGLQRVQKKRVGIQFFCIALLPNLDIVEITKLCA